MARDTDLGMPAKAEGEGGKSVWIASNLKPYLFIELSAQTIQADRGGTSSYGGGG